MAVRIEDAGFEIRDMIAWVYGSGFPKSADVSKRIDLEERKQWLDVSKAIDNLEVLSIMEAWKKHLKIASDAELSFARNQIETGTNTLKSGFALGRVLIQADPESSDALALLADLSSREALLTLNPEKTSALTFADASEPQSLAKHAENSQKRETAKFTIIGIALCDAKESPSVSMASRLKGVEALRTWLGSNTSSRLAATNALCAALTEDLRRIILSQSKIFQSLDTTRQTDCASAITVTITESTAESLILFTAGILKSKAIDKAAGAEREVVGTAFRSNAPGTVTNKVEWVRDVEYPITAPATEAAKQWEGWGTALKPSLEPITLARKPLKTSCVNVLAVVESSLRNQGVKGDIKWKKENASGAGKKKLKASLDSTRHLEPSAVYAKSAGETETGSEERQTRKSLEKPMPIGEQKTGSTTGVTQNPSAKNCEIKSYPLTVESANAAERPNQFSLQSTISTAEGPSTGNLFTEKFTSNSKETDTLRDTESFVGIATGLTGSMASVRIVRDLEGRFLWPSGLPEFVPGSQLTVAANVLEHGTGGLNIDGCRIEGKPPSVPQPSLGVRERITCGFGTGEGRNGEMSEASGRFPANFIHDGSQEVLALLGDAARFFYTAKASKADREEGVAGVAGVGALRDNGRESMPRKNHHPTVKPTDLMRYLCRLITPPNGIVLDPFMGSGSTGKAAMAEGFRFIGIEREAEYIEIARARISAEADKPRQLSLF
jgi:hypothetical protein